MQGGSQRQLDLPVCYRVVRMAGKAMDVNGLWNNNGNASCVHLCTCVLLSASSQALAFQRLPPAAQIGIVEYGVKLS